MYKYRVSPVSSNFTIFNPYDKVGDGPPKKPCEQAGYPACPNHAKKLKCGYKQGTHKYVDGQWQEVSATEVAAAPNTTEAPMNTIDAMARPGSGPSRPTRTTAGISWHH